jgi:hypothetical protein
MAKKQGDVPKRKVVIYVEVDPALKAAMEALAGRHERKLTGEVVVALRQYIASQASETDPPRDRAAPGRSRPGGTSGGRK